MQEDLIGRVCALEESVQLLQSAELVEPEQQGAADVANPSAAALQLQVDELSKRVVKIAGGLHTDTQLSRDRSVHKLNTSHTALMQRVRVVE